MLVFPRHAEKLDKQTNQTCVSVSVVRMFVPGKSGTLTTWNMTLTLNYTINYWAAEKHVVVYTEIKYNMLPNEHLWLVIHSRKVLAIVKDIFIYKHKTKQNRIINWLVKKKRNRFFNARLTDHLFWQRVFVILQYKNISISWFNPNHINSF